MSTVTITVDLEKMTPDQRDAMQTIIRGYAVTPPVEFRTDGLSKIAAIKMIRTFAFKMCDSHGLSPHGHDMTGLFNCKKFYEDFMNGKY